MVGSESARLLYGSPMRRYDFFCDGRASAPKGANGAKGALGGGCDSRARACLCARVRVCVSRESRPADDAELTGKRAGPAAGLHRNLMSTVPTKWARSRRNHSRCGLSTLSAIASGILRRQQMAGHGGGGVETARSLNTQGPPPRNGCPSRIPSPGPALGNFPEN